MIMNQIGGVGFPLNFPKPTMSPPTAPTGDATNDAILKRLHYLEQLLIKNMHHTETVIAAAVEHILKAQKTHGK